MSNFKYSYEVDQFLNNKYDAARLDREIRDSSIIVSLAYLEGSDMGCDVYFKAELEDKDWTTLSGIVANHTGDPIVEVLVQDVNIASSAPNVELSTALDQMPYDRSGKLRIHQTSRKLGLRIMWTGVGDDTTDIKKVGDGEPFAFSYKVGNEDPLVKYIDFNIVTNETFLHEGYITWKDCDLDTLTLQMVPRTVTVSGVVGGNKTIYGGYMVVPTASGSGNYEVVNDLTLPHGGLVYMPTNDLGIAPIAYWDADYNTVTKKYENIRPNSLGTGRYNIFSYEVVFATFIRQLPLLASGFIALGSSDTDQMGQGMRLKMIADTNKSIQDHDWSVACIMCMHRFKSV